MNTNTEFQAGFNAYTEGVSPSSVWSAEFDRGFWAAHDEASAEYVCEDPCLDEYMGNCSGTVEYRFALSGTGKSFPRCDGHWSERLDRQDEINKRYPDSPMAPSDFDPTFAGEVWDWN